MSTIWVYLSQTPLLWLTATLAIYYGAAQLTLWLGSPAWCHPVPIAIAVIVALLLSTGTPYERYFDGAQFVHFLLGPATVALAIPLAGQARRLRRIALPAAITLTLGAAAGLLSAGLFGRLVGLSDPTLRSLLPKSVTTPIAMGISEQLGGLPELTAVLVITTGLIGALIGPPLLSWLRIGVASGRGFALGICAHGLGTARAFQLSSEVGAFAGLAMGLNAALTTLLAPPIAWMLGL